MKCVCLSLAAALALAVPSFAQSAEETPFAEMVVTYKNAVESTARYTTPAELSAAIDATKSSKDLTITLLRDYTVNAPFVIKNSTIQDVTLDLAGHTLSAAVETDDGAGNVRYFNPIETSVRLVIKDSSETQTGIVRGRAIENTATLTIEGGTFIECDTGTGSQSGAAIYNTKKLIINGGVFKTAYAGSSADAGGPACVRNVGDKATLTITGGTFDSVSQRTYAIISSGEVEISPADGKSVTVSGPRALAIDSGTAVINGGTFTATGWYGLYVSNDGLGEDPMVAAVTINGGTFQGKEYAVWVGSDHNNPVNSTVYINDGVFVNALNRQEVTREDAIVAQGGTYAADPTTYGVVIAPGFKLESKADGKFEIVEGPAFAIGDTLYETLGEALAALVPAEGATLAEGEVPTITLLRDTASEIQALVPHGANGIFDLNGFTYTYVASASFTSAINAHRGQASDPAITLTITDSSAAQTGTIVAQGYADGCIASTNSNLTITGGRFIQEGNSGYAIAGTDGLVIAPAEGRTVELPSGGLNLREGSWTAIKNEGVTIAGGTFIAGNEPAYALYTGNGNGPTTLSISGGTFEGGTNGYVAYFATKTKVDISGGDFTDGDLYINAPDSTTVTVSGGDFRDDPRDYGAVLPPDYSVVGKGNSVTAQPDAGATYFAQIGAVKYTDMLVAFKALKNGDTIKLLADYVGTKRLEAKAFGVTVDLNGHTIDGGLYFHPLYSTEYCDNPNCAVIDTSDKPGTIKGKLPLEAGSGNSQNTFAVSVQEGIVLEVAEGGDASVSLKLGSGTRVLAEDRYIAWLGTANPLFKATDADNQAWIFPTFGAAVPFAADGVATLCADYSGNAELTLVGKTLTLDLGGHTYERIVSAGSSDNSIVDCTTSNTHLTIRNGTLKGNGYGVLYVPPSGKTISNLSLTMEDVTLASTFEATAGVGAGLMANGTMENVDFTLRRCKILLGAFAAEPDGVQTQVVTDPNANICAIYFPPRGDSTLIIEDTIIKSPYGVQVCAGNLVVKGDTRITTTAANVASSKTGDGPIPDGAAISIVNRAGYGNVGTVTIEGKPTLIAQGEGAAAVDAYSWSDNTQSDWAASADHIAISGGTFSEKPDNAWFADGFIPVKNEDGTFGVAPGSFAAEIDGVKYLTLKEAIAAVPENGTDATTITLLDNVTSAGSLTLTNGQKAILNMNGKTVTFTSGKLQLLTSTSLTLTGEGALVCQSSGTGAISIYGNETSQIDLLVDSGVTVDGHYGIALFGNGAPACRNVTVTVKGTVKTSEGGSALYVNGTVNNTEGSVPQIILAEGAKVEAASIGIYAAGYAKWDLAGTINAGNDAISVKSGTFNITGGSYTANGPYVECPVANSNGTEHVGAAIGITTNGDYAKPIVVNITGGDFISTNGYALYEGIAKTSDGTPAAEASAAVIAIQGGDFTGNADLGADIAITTAENPRVISGGTFSKPIPEALCALGYVPVDTPNAEGKYTVEHPLFTKVGVQMADGRYKVYDSMYAACYDTTMIAQEGVTGTIIVLEDIEFSSYFRVLAGQNVTFDLNGHTVTCTGDLGFSYAIDWVCNDDITAKPTVTITDSSIGQTGVLRSDGPYLDGLVRMVGGKLNITGGRFVQDVDNPNAQYKDNITVLTEGLTVDPEPGRTVEFSGGTIQVESNAATSVQNFGTAIKGGLFHSSEGRPAIEVAHVTQGLVVSGGSFEGDGNAILISAPATITISGGDFTDDIVAIKNAGATVKLSGGVFENAVFTGPGTLDVNPAINDLSMARVDTSLGKLMLAGDLDIGTNRLPNTTVEISASATVSMDAVEKELEIGKVNVFSAGGQMEAPQNLTLTVGNLLATQTLAESTISVENDTIVLTFLAVPTELAGSEAFLAYLRQEDLGSIVSVTGTTKGGTVALTATELNEALSVFRLTNDLFTLGDTDGGKTLAVAYDFGITDVRVQRDTGDLVVTVAVQNAAAEPLAFADGVTFVLRNGETALEATPATVDGVTTLTVPAVKLPAGVLRLSVSVAPAAEVETPAE